MSEVIFIQNGSCLFCYISRELVVLYITASSGECIQFPIAPLYLNNCNSVKESLKF